MTLVTSLRRQARIFRTRRALAARPFAFVHINKCGGTSVEKSLGLPFAHYTAAELKQLFGARRWDRIYRFAVVRNPYSRVVSLYNFRRKTGQTGMDDGHIGFDDWLFECFERQNPRYRNKPRFFLTCRDWLVDAEGRMLVDRVFRLEELGAAWPEIQRRTGVAAELRHDNASRGEDLGRIYSAASRARRTSSRARRLSTASPRRPACTRSRRFGRTITLYSLRACACCAPTRTRM